MENNKKPKEKPVPPAMTQYVFLQAQDLLTQVALIDESDLKPIKQETKTEEKKGKKEGENK